jgi:hypothetical protein
MQNNYLENKPKLIITIFKYDKNSGGNGILPNMIKHINKLFNDPVIYSYIFLDDSDTGPNPSRDEYFFLLKIPLYNH